MTEGTRVLSTPYRDLLPPLATEEMDALYASIKLEGVRDPVVIDELGQVLDGHHRLMVAPDAPVRVVSGLTEAEKLAYVLQSNFARRNLSPDQKRERTKRRQEIARQLRDEDLVKNTQERIAALLGVDRSTVTKWLIISDVNNHNANKPKSSVKVESEQRPLILEAVESGQKQAQVAADYGISQGRVAQIVKTERKRKDKKAKAAAAIAEAKEWTPTIALANMTEWLTGQSDCDLLLTDPPYMTDVPDIAQFAYDWLPLALGKVKSTGRAYVCIGSYPDELRAYLTIDPPDHLILDDVLVWTNRAVLGPSPKYGYKRNWQAILYYRGVDAPPINCDTLVEQFSVQDINPPRSDNDPSYHPWQKPIELAERFIRHSTKPGQLILDPFAGTGTFLIAASKLKRLARGCDKSQQMIDIAIKRGCVLGG